MRQLGVDFGLSNTDIVLVEEGKLIGHWMVEGKASLETLHKALEVAKVGPNDLDCIATSGGRHGDLPSRFEGIELRKANEAQAVGLGGLALSGFTEALVVSAGTGTAMIVARGKEASHFTGSAVGGGTLLGLSRLLLGTSDPLEISRLAQLGNPSGVDSTLIDVIGGGIGHLPPDATAVNFGRMVYQPKASREDVAAGLVTLVSQVIAMIAINAVKAAGLSQIVIVGHLSDLPPVQKALERVWGFYQVQPTPVIPPHAGAVTAYGAVLSV